MRNKYNEPKSGCSMLIGCGSLLIISLIISMIIMVSLLSSYASEINARSSGNYDEYLSYITSLAESIYDEMVVLEQNSFLMTLINAAQIVVLFIVFKLIYKRPINQMGISQRHWIKHMCLGCLAGFTAISFYVLITSISGIAEFSNFNPSNFFMINMFTSFIFFISVGFYEEILCRGYFMTALKTTRKKWVIIALPAVIFGIMHLGNPKVSLVSIVNIILIGLAFAYMFIKTGSLWMPIGYHIIWNFFQGNIYGIPVSGMRQGFPLMKYTATGPEILTGGAFGAEGGLICTAITLALLVYIHFGINVKEPPAWTLESDLPFNSFK